MLPAGSVDVIIINEIGKYYNIEGALIYNENIRPDSGKNKRKLL